MCNTSNYVFYFYKRRLKVVTTFQKGEFFLNIIFHTTSAIASGIVVSSVLDKKHSNKWHIKNRVLLFCVLINVILHGALDLLPHSYPLRGKFDVILSLSILIGIHIFIKSKYIFVFASCFFGSILPDIIDLGPAIVNKLNIVNLPVVKIFPWHWPQYSGSIFDNSNFYISFLNHLIVSSFFILVIYIYRKYILKSILRN